MQLLIALLLAVAASVDSYGYGYSNGYAPSYSTYGGYDGALGYSSLGGYGYGDSYSYAPSYYGGSTYGSGVSYVAAKPAVSYVSQPAVSYVSQPAVQYVAAPRVEKYVAPAVSYVSKPAVQYVAPAPAVSYVAKPAVQYVAAPRVEKLYTVPTHYASGNTGRNPSAPVQPSRISFTMGHNAAFTTSNRSPPARSYTSKKVEVPTQTQYVPKPQSTFTPVKPSKVSTPVVKPVQEPITIVSQQPQTKNSYRNVAPGEETFSAFDVQPGSKLAIGDQTFVVVPVGDYDGKKESVYTHSNDKSSISDGSFFPFPSDTYTQDKPTAYKYPLVYRQSTNAAVAPEDSYVYNNEEQQSGLSAGNYESGYNQENPSPIFYGSEYADDKASVSNYGPEYVDDGASATLYSPGNKQSRYGGDQTLAGNYGSEEKGESPVSYGSDYSGNIGSADSYTGFKRNKGVYGAN